MSIICPDYCNKFKCIADKCQHSCCVGWEIDIDPASLERYTNESGALGDRLRANIDKTADGASFRLTADERCPFLDSHNLCELITAKGEGYICNICTEHPRFYNEYETHTEMGLGMCCEEAARIILSSDFNFDCSAFPERQKIFDLLKDSSMIFAEKIHTLEDGNEIEINCDSSYWADVLSQMEMLDPQWKEYISLLNGQNQVILAENDEFQAEFERIALYLTYRWYNAMECVNDNCLCEYYPDEVMGFITASLYIISTLFMAGEQSRQRLCEICRLFSSEIEYSDRNPIDLLEAVFE